MASASRLAVLRRSTGSTLPRLKPLADRYQPAQMSEHLAWSTHEGAFFNDLLPLPYTNETLALVARHVDEAQQAARPPLADREPLDLCRASTDNDMSEIEFLDELARRTGCGLLLDVNNVYVGATNHAYDPVAYIDAFPVEHVGEIHLGGHARRGRRHRRPAAGRCA